MPTPSPRWPAPGAPQRIRIWLASALVASLYFAPPSVQARSPIAVAAAEQVPFVEAGVTQSSDGLVVHWAAPSASRVKIFAIPTPIAQGGKLVGEGNSRDQLKLAPGLVSYRYFRLVPDRGSPLVVADRGLRLASVPNLRDVGGLRTADGKWVRLGVLYRSDQLDRISDADLAALNALDIGVVADLRTESERLKGPDRLPAGARGVSFDVLGAQGDLNAAMRDIEQGQGAKLMMRLYGNMVSLDTSRQAYRKLLAEAIDGSGPLLFHCTAGKDRTGWGAAVILSLLGVPRDIVIDDYLASNAFLAAKNERAYAAAVPRIARDRLEPVLTVQRDYIEQSFAEVDRLYGSIDNYARDGLGLAPEQIAALRRKYLVGTASF